MSILKQIIKWFSGGFFRRLGSIFAFIVIGMLLALLMAKNDIRLPSIIGFDYVNAATVSKATDQWALQFCADRTCDYTLGGSTTYRDYANVNASSYTNNAHYYLTAIRLRQTFNSSNYLQSGTQYQFRYKLHFSPKYKMSYYNPTSWGYDFTITDTGNNSTTLDTGDYSCSVSDITNSDTAWFLTCTYTPTSNLKQVYIRLTFPYTFYVSYAGFSGYIFKSLDYINYTSSQISYATGSIDAINNQTTIIQNQTNEINNSINNITDTLTDDNVTSDVNDMGSFLNNFSSNEDSAISSIITLPLNFISTLFEDTTCPNLSFTLKGVTSTLPCGDIIWGKTSANSIFGVVSISTFKTFFNLVVGGFICYKLLMGVVHTYETAIDPMESGLGRKGVLKL